MVKKTVLLCLFILALSTTAFALADLAGVNATLHHFKLKLSNYAQNQDNPEWLIQFKQFISKRVVESPERKGLIKAACAPWKESYYQECISGSMGFMQSAEGLRNALELYQTECQFDKTKGNCPYYVRMLNQDVDQLKYILKVS